MTATSFISVAAGAQGEPSGSFEYGPAIIPGVNAVAETALFFLASGDNTIAVPAGAVAAVVTPPALNAVALRLRCSLNSGDAGLPLNPGALPLVYPFPAVAPSSLIVNAAGTPVAPVSVVFV